MLDIVRLMVETARNTPNDPVLDDVDVIEIIVPQNGHQDEGLERREYSREKEIIAQAIITDAWGTLERYLRSGLILAFDKGLGPQLVSQRMALIYQRPPEEIAQMMEEALSQLRQIQESTTMEAKCPHHWILETPNGAISSGRCRLCDATKEFINAF